MGLLTKYIGFAGQRRANLDNRIAKNDRGTNTESEEKMGNGFRQSYSYLDRNGDLCSIRLEGRNKQDTDLKFQKFLSKKPGSVTTFKDFVEKTYKPSFIDGLSPMTQANYDRYLNLYIFPEIGDLNLSDITVADIQTMYNHMAKGATYGRRNDINKRSIERVGGLLGRIFKIAVEMDMIESSPFKKDLLRNQGAQSTHHVALPDSEVARVKRLIPTITDPRQLLYIALLVYTGMRREEVLGMRWEFIHLEERYGEVRQVVIYPDNKVAVIKDTPKTESSGRTFVIPESLASILERFKKERGFVVHGRDDESPLSYSTLQRTYRNVFKFLGIENYDNHDWRATYGTELKEAGLTSAQVADHLGHADTRMVETVYARARHEGIMKNKHTIDQLDSQPQLAHVWP